MTGDVVLEQSSKQLAKMGIKRSSEQLKKAIKVTQPQNSLMFTINITDSNRYDAKIIADIVSQIFRENIKKYINVSKISVISQAQVAQKPATPNKVFNLMIGLILGLLIGSVLAVFLEMTDLTVKDESFIKDNLDLPIIGYIAQIPQHDLQKTLVNQSLAKNNFSTKVLRRS